MECSKIEVRKYNTTEIIKISNYLTNEIMNNVRNSKGGMYDYNYKFKQKTNYGVTNTYILMPNYISKIIYLSITESNDYKSNVKTIDDYKRIMINLNHIMLDEDNSFWKLNNDDIDNFDYFLAMVSQTQMWWQSYHDLFRKIGRIKNIFNTSNNIDIININPNDMILRTFGITLNDFITYCENLFLLTYYGTDITKIKSETLKEYNMSKIVVDEIINVLTVSYDECKNSKVGYNIVLYRPIIKTSKGEIIVSNYIALLKSLSELPYYLIRNKYMDNKQTFPNDFGVLFENYLPTLFNNNSKYKPLKISSPTKKKMADWILETEDYIFIIEQKSTMMKASLKLENISLSDLDDYAVNRLGKGILQLNQSEEAVENKNNKKIVKLLLHYEDIYIQSYIKSRIEKNKNIDTSDIVFISIEEMEDLIEILFKDEDTFSKIIKEIIRRNKVSGAEWRSCNQIISDISKENI